MNKVGLGPHLFQSNSSLTGWRRRKHYYDHHTYFIRRTALDWELLHAICILQVLEECRSVLTRLGPTKVTRKVSDTNFHLLFCIAISLSLESFYQPNEWPSVNVKVRRLLYSTLALRNLNLSTYMFNDLEGVRSIRNAWFNIFNKL